MEEVGKKTSTQIEKEEKHLKSLSRRFIALVCTNVLFVILIIWCLAEMFTH